MRSALILLCYTALLFCGCEKAVPPPNVLFIAVDDLRTELNCYGAKHIHSPNIDRLASLGVRFNRAHVQQAICMASRASILTGIRPEHRGIYTGKSVGDLVPDVKTLNQHFRENGYEVAAFGKIYHYGADREQQFGDRHFNADEKWLGRGYADPEAAKYIEQNVAQKGEKVKGKGFPFEWADVADDAYEDGYNTQLALEKLEAFSQRDQPFFMAFGFRKPHLPFNAPKKYWDLYPEETVALPDLVSAPENANPYTLRGWGELRSYYSMPAEPDPVTADTSLILRRGYFACVSYVDAMIGKLMEKLEVLGLAENTIIVLWGDHGYKLGDYSYWCKWSNMTIDTNVPLIIRAPGYGQNKKCEVPVETLDLYPTLAELCGLSVPAHTEGKSLVKLLEEPEAPAENFAYTIWPHYRTTYDKTIMGYSVKTVRYNYVEWVNLSSREVLEKELYDHEKHPKETRNVIAEPSYAEIAAQLSAKIEVRKKSTDHNHPFNE